MRQIRGGTFEITLGIYSGGNSEICFDLELGKQKNIIAKELAGEIVKGSEACVTKISKGLFRYAVEVEMIIMILSELANVPHEVIEEYRKEAIRNVRRTRGKINRRAEAKIENSTPMKDGFSVIDNVLYYISGKTRIKIKEHFAETKVTALDLVESAIRYEKCTQATG